MPRTPALNQTTDRTARMDAAKQVIADLLAHSDASGLFDFLQHHKVRILGNPIKHEVFTRHFYATGLQREVHDLNADNAPDINAAFIQAAGFSDALDQYAQNLKGPNPKTMIWMIPPALEFMPKIHELCDQHQASKTRSSRLLMRLFEIANPDLAAQTEMKTIEKIRSELKSGFQPIIEMLCKNVEDHSEFRFTSPPNKSASYHFDIPLTVAPKEANKDPVNFKNDSLYPHTDSNSAVIINFDERYGGTYLYPQNALQELDGFRHLLPLNQEPIPTYEVPRPSVAFIPPNTPHSGNPLSDRMMSRAFLSQTFNLPRPEDIKTTPVSGRANYLARRKTLQIYNEWYNFKP